MASTLICDGTTIRIELGKLSWAAFRALPVFCCAFYSFLAAIMGVKDLIAVTDHGIGDYFSVFLFFILGLAFSVPGLMIVSRRLFVIDKVRGQVHRIFKIGPFKWRSSRKLSDFNLVRVDWEPDNGDGGGTYFVCLSCGAGAAALRIDSFESAQPANGLARELGRALELPVRDAPSGLRQRARRSGAEKPGNRDEEPAP